MSILKPYIERYIIEQIPLYSHQLDNHLYDHLKNNINEIYLGRCYKGHGCIVEITDICDVKEGRIVTEDPLCVILFNVQFNCKICIPIQDKQIVCKVDKLNRSSVLKLINGPLLIIISSDRIQKSHFIIDQNSNIIIKDTNQPLTPGMFVIATILQKSIYDHDKAIVALATLDRMATDEEVRLFY
jgi:DNA-directed RNA polymerase subunit E'/Rpb7